MAKPSRYNRRKVGTAWAWWFILDGDGGGVFAYLGGSGGGHFARFLLCELSGRVGLITSRILKIANGEWGQGLHL